MTNRDIVKKLRAEGHTVSYRARKDGSIRIKSIDGVKFKDSEGNNAARLMADSQLSDKRRHQLIENQEKAKRGTRLAKKKKYGKLSKSQEKLLKKINYRVKKYGGKGRIGKTNAKKIIKEGGNDALIQKGNELIRKALGLANPFSVESEASAIVDLGGGHANKTGANLASKSHYITQDALNEIQLLRYEVKQYAIELIKANGLGYDVVNDPDYIELRERNLTSIDNIIQNTYNMVKGYVDGI